MSKPASGQTPKIAPINARSETVASSRMFSQAFQRRRCLLPADGFYEWQKEGTRKQPFFIHSGDDLIAFAGLWERWKLDDDAEPLDTCTILTTTPNETMKTIHNRMPVILRCDDYGKWLDPQGRPDDLLKLLRPYEGELEAYPVSLYVNSPKNDDQQCIQPI